MCELVQKWEDLGCSTDAYFATPFPDQDEIYGNSNPNDSVA